MHIQRNALFGLSDAKTFFGLHFFVFLFLVTGFVSVANADDAVVVSAEPSSVQEDSGRVVEVASVNVYDAKITKQDGRNIEVSFQVVNGKGVQAGLTYGVQISRMTSSSTMQDVDLFVAPEKLTLKQNEAIDKSFAFTLGEYLSPGDYMIRVLVGGPSGSIFGFNQAGIIGVPEGSGEKVGLHDCTVRIGSEGISKVYSLGQGVDIASGEDLQLVCLASNTTDHMVDVVPNFATFRQTMLSNQSAEAPATHSENTSLAPGVTQQIVLSLPVARVPQAYDVQTFLVNTDGKRVSNGVIAHYVLRGASASVQNILFDKPVYQVGDDAHVTYVWSGSADSFPGSRVGHGTDTGVLAATFRLMSEGKDCADPVTKDAKDGDAREVIVFQVRTVCDRPELLAELKQESGVILDQITLETVPKTATLKASLKDRWAEHVLIYDFLLVVGAILLILLVIKLRKHGAKDAIVLALLVGSVALMSAHGAKADTAYLQAPFGGGRVQFDYGISGGRYIPGTVDNNGFTPGAQVYYPGESITPYGIGYVSVCSNTANATIRGYGKPWVGYGGSGLGESLFSVSGNLNTADCHTTGSCTQYALLGGLAESLFGTFPSHTLSSNKLGNQKAEFRFHYVGSSDGTNQNSWQLGTGPLYMSYRVDNNAVVGKCGSADGHTFSSGDSSYGAYAQCASGTSTNGAFPSQGGSTTWVCQGANGGGDSGQCSASRSGASGWECGDANGHPEKIHFAGNDIITYVPGWGTNNNLCKFNGAGVYFDWGDDIGGGWKYLKYQPAGTNNGAWHTTGRKNGYGQWDGWEWKCGSNYCSASRDPQPVVGVCNPDANGRVVYNDIRPNGNSDPATNPGAYCSSGTLGNFKWPGEDGIDQYRWTCSGESPQAVSCSAEKQYCNAPNTVVNGVCTPPVPTASLTVNGSHSITVNKGDSVNYVWNSTNGSDYSAAWSSSCGGSGGWGLNLDNGVSSPATGSRTESTHDWSEGCIYTVTYSVSGPGGSTSDQVSITVNNPPPIGYIVGNCDNIWGWTCDPSNFDTSVEVHLYQDGPAFPPPVGTIRIGGIIASNEVRDDGAANLCGGRYNHWFSVSTPASFKDDNEHSVYVHAIDPSGNGNNPVLGGSGLKIQCPIYLTICKDGVSVDPTVLRGDTGSFKAYLSSSEGSCSGTDVTSSATWSVAGAADNGLVGGYQQLFFNQFTWPASSATLSASYNGKSDTMTINVGCVNTWTPVRPLDQVCSGDTVRATSSCGAPDSTLNGIKNCNRVKYWREVAP